MSLHDRVHSLIETAQRLGTVLDAETEILNGYDVNGVQELQEEKASLSNLYEKGLLTLQAHKAQLDSLPNPLKLRLKNTLTEFQEKSTVNKRALKAARDARRFVLNAIKEAAMDQQKPTETYSAKGRVQKSAMYHSNRGYSVAVAMDQQL